MLLFVFIFLFFFTTQFSISSFVFFIIYHLFYWKPCFSLSFFSFFAFLRKRQDRWERKILKTVNPELWLEKVKNLNFKCQKKYTKLTKLNFKCIEMESFWVLDTFFFYLVSILPRKFFCRFFFCIYCFWALFWALFYYLVSVNFLFSSCIFFRVGNLFETGCLVFIVESR